MELSKQLVAQIGNNHTASVIFFHGSGDSADSLIKWVRFLLGSNIQFPHIKMIYPNAPRQPYTPLEGRQSNVWFDRKAIAPSARESRASMATIYESVKDLVDAEVNSGIPLNRIVVGGYSMGGALAMHTAYHIQPKLRGCFALSSFLNTDSIVYESLRAKSKSPKPADLLMMHGDMDSLVAPEWGLSTFGALKSLGVPADFEMVPNAKHELKQSELLRVRDWILEMLPFEERYVDKLKQPNGTHCVSCYNKIIS